MSTPYPLFLLLLSLLGGAPCHAALAELSLSDVAFTSLAHEHPDLLKQFCPALDPTIASKEDLQMALKQASITWDGVLLSSAIDIFLKTDCAFQLGLFSFYTLIGSGDLKTLERLMPSTKRVGDKRIASCYTSLPDTFSLLLGTAVKEQRLSLAKCLLEHDILPTASIYAHLLQQDISGQPALWSLVGEQHVPIECTPGFLVAWSTATLSCGGRPPTTKHYCLVPAYQALKELPLECLIKEQDTIREHPNFHLTSYCYPYVPSKAREMKLQFLTKLGEDDYWKLLHAMILQGCFVDRQRDKPYVDITPEILASGYLRTNVSFSFDHLMGILLRYLDPSCCFSAKCCLPPHFFATHCLHPKLSCSEAYPDLTYLARSSQTSLLL